MRHATTAVTLVAALASTAPVFALGHSSAPSKPQPSIDAATVLAVRIPAQLASGASGTFEVDVQNTGTTTWCDDFKLGVVGDQAGPARYFLEGVPGQDPIRIWLPKGTTVAPGAKYTFKAAVVGPKKPGTYVVQLRMVHEGVAWFGGLAAQVVTVTAATTTGPVNGEDAKVTSIRIPAQAAPGAPVHIEIDVVNAGSTTWMHDTHKLGVVGDTAGDAYLFLKGKPGQDPTRIWMQPGSTVTTGGVTTFSADAVAPMQAKKYQLRFQMVHEGVAWFGPIAEQTLEVTGTTTPPPSSNVVIDDPLMGATKGNKVGGTLTATGYRIDAANDHITYEVPTIKEGAFEISVKGLVNGLAPGNVEDCELVVMYDGSYSPDPEKDYNGYRNNPYKFFLRKRGNDDVKVCYKTPTTYVEEPSGKSAWDPSHTYRFRCEWAGGTVKTYMDGQLVKTISPGGDWLPVKHRIRVGTGGAGRVWPGVVFSNLLVTRGGSVTTPPTGPPPVPGMGPQPALDPTNTLRMIDKKTGKQFFWVGKTAFALSGQVKWREFIDEAATNGIDVIRVLVGASKTASFGVGQTYPLFPFLANGQPDPAHFQRLDDIVAYAGQKNVVVELVLFEPGMNGDLPDPTNYDAAKKQYVAFVVNRYKTAPNIVWEVANEYTHFNNSGAYPYSSLPDQFVIGVAKDIQRLDGAHLVGLSDQGATAPPRPCSDPAFTMANIHIDRGGEWWKKAWDIFRANTGLGKPLLNDEPMGSDFQNAGNRDSDGTRHRANAWISAIAGGYYTFHCSLGLPASPGPQPGQEFLKAYHDFFDSLEVSRFSASLDVVKATGAAEKYGCRDFDAQFLVYLRDGDLSKPLTLLLPPGTYDVRVIDPATGRVLATQTVAGGANADVALAGATKDVAVHAKRR